MARAKAKTKTTSRKLTKKATPEKATRTREKSPSLTERIQADISQNNSLLNMILGALILIVLGVLIFNYFNREDPNQGILEPASETQTDSSIDVSKENLPGTYTVKTGDTLYSIAQNYYGNGFLYPTIVEENKLSNENIEAGQKITIPKIEDQTAEASPTPAPTEQTLLGSQPEESNETPVTPEAATGGAENQTIWGERISGDTYTVQADDWLSKIAGRAYGDVMQYQRIAQANNIQNPDVIEVGTVLKIPR